MHRWKAPTFGISSKRETMCTNLKNVKIIIWILTAFVRELMFKSHNLKLT